LRVFAVAKRHPASFVGVSQGRRNSLPVVENMWGGGVRLPFQRSSLKGMPTMYEYKTGDEIIGSVVSAGPDFVGRDVEYQSRRSQEESDNKVPAFEALVAALATALENQNDASVPLWVVRQIAPGLKAYLDNPTGPTIEQRLGIRSSKSGGHSQIKKEKTKWRGRYIALEVAQMIGPNPKDGDVEKAIQVVKTKRNISESSVLKAWGEHGDIAWNQAVGFQIWDKSTPISEPQ
jgi:hypothetical protein